MNPMLRLYEDTITAGVADVKLKALPRMLFVVHGSALRFTSATPAVMVSS